MSTIKHFDPSRGQAYQGDVVILPLPRSIRIRTDDPIPMRDGMLVLAEGEVTGHHHAIRYGLEAASRFHDAALARSFDRDTSTTPDASIQTPAADARSIPALYRDPEALSAMVRAGILTTDSLCVGFLRVEDECPPLTHDEHGAIQIPAGDYYVGLKREMDAGETRRVAD